MMYSDKLWRPIATEDDGRLHRNICFGGGGGDQRTYQQTNTQSSSDVGPNSAIFDTLNRWGTDLSKYYNAHPDAPGWFPGGTLAKQSGQTVQSINDLYGRGYGSPFKTASQDLATNTVGGKFLDLSTNPYFQGAISYAQQPLIDAFNKQILPSITGTFEGAGRTPQAGNLAGNAVQTATDTLARNLAGAATTAGANAYTTERGNQMNALSMLPSFQNADYQDLQARLQAGGMLDQRAQQELDAANQKYAYEATAQPDWITQMAQRLQTIVPGSHSTGSTNSSGYSFTPGSGSSPIGSILGGLGLGLQAYKTLFPAAAGAGSAIGPAVGSMMLMSDKRDKTDIKKLGGKDPRTGLPVYAYRYKGDPKSYPKVVGPMAQDAERAGLPVGQFGGHRVMAMRRPMPPGGLM